MGEEQNEEKEHLKGRTDLVGGVGEQRPGKPGVIVEAAFLQLGV